MECPRIMPLEVVQRDDGHDPSTSIEAFDHSAGSGIGASDTVAPAATCLQRGHVLLDGELLRRLRQARMFSQQDLADECWRRNIRLSLTTIKRAESGRAVRFRIAREFARCFDLPVERIAGMLAHARGAAGR